MLRGLYSAASGMIAQQRKHDTVTNNIANLNTPGFKQEIAVNRSFPEMLISVMRSKEGGNHVIGQLSNGVFAEENLNLFAQGDLQETGVSSDFAIISNIQVPGVTFDASGKAVGPNGDKLFQPQAFFTLLTEDGQERYTRNGKFKVDENGMLTTAEGLQVMGEGRQPIRLDPGISMSDILMTPSGQLINGVTGDPVLTAGGAQASLYISRVNDPNLLVRDGNGNYRLEGEGATAERAGEADQFQVRQGFVERSNVDPAASMVDLMSALRAYEANQKVVQFYDKSMDKAVNEVGRI